jgi:uncharacterized delta-60 repeat protein
MATGEADRGLQGFSGPAVVDQPRGAILIGTALHQLTRFRADGTLDTTFGKGGSITIPVTGGIIAPVTNGDIVLGADEAFTLGSSITRMHPNGSIVRSFGSRGTADVSIGLAAMTVQADGKILLYGSALTNGSISANQMEVVRLLPNGKLDSKFGVAGVSPVTFPDLGNGTQPGSLFLLANGEIVVTATQVDQPPNINAAERTVAARFESNGQVDAGFGDGGVDLLPVIDPFGTEVSENVAVEPDGAFMVVDDGNADMFGNITPVSVYGFQSDGAADTNFGVAGISALTDAPFGGGYQIFVRPDKTIELIGGTQATTSIILLNSDGNLDTQNAAFGPTGMLTELAGDPIAVVQQSADKTLVFTNNSPKDGLTGDALVRYDLNGQVDSSFGYGGVVIDPYGISGATNTVTVEKSKQIIIAGSELAPVASFPTAGALARYQTDGSLDTSFGVAGRAIIKFGSDATFETVATGKNGMIYAVATGDGGSPSSPEYALYNFTPNGRLNRRFGVGGRVMFSGPIGGVSVQANGRILTASAVGGTSPAVLSRYLPNGRLDVHFGVNGRVALGTNANAQSGMIVEPDGSIIVCGDVDTRKFNANGVLDPNFVPVSNFGGLYAMALAPNGDIVSVSEFPSGPPLYVVSILPTGQLDPNFATGGVLTLNDTDSSIVKLQSVALQANGRIIAGVIINPGDINDTTVPQLSVVGIAPNGTIDPTFGPYTNSSAAGYAFLAEASFDTPANDSISAITLQPDGKILVAVNAANGGLDVTSSLFRLLGS